MEPALLVVIPVPKPRTKRAPAGPRSLGGNERVTSIRIADQDMIHLGKVARELDMTLSEFIRQSATACAKALSYGPPGKYPRSREYPARSIAEGLYDIREYP